jgi:hypothetical protein
VEGCKTGAKWSALYTEIPRAEATGNLDLRTQCMVARIEHGADGKVTGVLYRRSAGHQQRQKARRPANQDFPAGLGGPPRDGYIDVRASRRNDAAASIQIPTLRMGSL